MDRSETCDAPTGGKPGRMIRCSQPATSTRQCEHCELRIGICGKQGHYLAALGSLNGHVLVSHPEKIPDVVAALARDERKTAEIFAAEKRSPAQFAKVAAIVRALRSASTLH